MTAVIAIDATGLSPSQITALAKAGVKFAGRYLSHSGWKGLTLGEVANLKAAGIDIFSIFESNPTQASYFNAANGKSDALDAVALAKSVGQPENTAIYFTVDYDAQSDDLANILAYFLAVKANLSGYLVAAYGSFTVLNYLHEHNAADLYFQTTAWSNGQRCSFLNLYQFQEDKTLANVQVDYDNLETEYIGSWSQAHVALPSPEWKVFKLTNPVYGLYTVPLSQWKCDTHQYVGWIFISKQTMTTQDGTPWHDLYLGDNEIGWASQPLLQEVPYTWGVVSVDTVSYVHSDMTQVHGTIPRESKVAIVDTQDDKYLVVSDNQPQWVPKNIVTQ